MLDVPSMLDEGVVLDPGRSPKLRHRRYPSHLSDMSGERERDVMDEEGSLTLSRTNQYRSISAVSQSGYTGIGLPLPAITERGDLSDTRDIVEDTPPLSARMTGPDSATGFLSRANLRRVVKERRWYFLKFSLFWLVFACVVLARSSVVYYVYYKFEDNVTAKGYCDVIWSAVLGNTAVIVVLAVVHPLVIKGNVPATLRDLFLIDHGHELFSLFIQRQGDTKARLMMEFLEASHQYRLDLADPDTDPTHLACAFYAEYLHSHDGAPVIAASKVALGRARFGLTSLAAYAYGAGRPREGVTSPDPSPDTPSTPQRQRTAIVAQ
ncbi:hypothetical protein KIPB_008520, partial [Kipferlia bialata]|eukprot:g8520.t1